LSLSMVRALFARRRSVRDDWLAWLPPDKLAFFQSVSTRWERALTMSGVALHDAFELRGRGRFEQARLHVQMASELVARNAAELARAVNLIRDESRHLANLPVVEPLDPENFRTEAARRLANWNTFFHHLLFGARTQFFQKLRLLEEMIEDACSGFVAVSDELMESNLAADAAPWEALADLECDLNTSARELEIIFKAFLRNLPANLTAAVREKVEAPPPPAPRRSRLRRTRVSS